MRALGPNPARPVRHHIHSGTECEARSIIFILCTQPYGFAWHLLRKLVTSRCGKVSCVLWYRLRQSRRGIKVGRGFSSRRWFLKKIKKSVRFTNYSAYWFWWYRWWYRWQPGTLQKVLKDLTDIVQRNEKKIKRSRKFVEISRGQIKYWGVTSTKRTLIIVFFA